MNRLPSRLLVVAVVAGLGLIGAASETGAAASQWAESRTPTFAPRTESVTRLISKGPLGQANGVSGVPVVSGDCRVVAYQSSSSNLVPGLRRQISRVYARIRGEHRVTLVSRALHGGSSNAESTPYGVSHAGRYITYASDASNLVRRDKNDSSDVFIRDLSQMRSELVSVANNGAAGNGVSRTPALSSNGRYIVFASSASNLVPRDTNGVSELFVRDRRLGQTSQLFADIDPFPNGNSYAPDMSASGRYVSFDSEADNLVPGDTNASSDTFRIDVQTGEIERASVGGGGQLAFGGSFSHISGNGRYIVFAAPSDDVVADDDNGNFDVFVRDMRSETTTLVSAAAGGGVGDGGSIDSAISGDGRLVAFLSHATDLVAGGTSHVQSIFRRNLATSRTSLASVSTTLAPGNQQSSMPQISANGMCIAFATSATNLVSNDANATDDVFLRRLAH